MAEKTENKNWKQQAYKTGLLYQALPSANNAFRPGNAEVYRK